jgi:hypothetical protein
MKTLFVPFFFLLLVNLSAQIDTQQLQGTWHLMEIKENAYQTEIEDIEIIPPGEVPDSIPFFRQKMAFDGQWMFFQMMKTIIRVGTFQINGTTLSFETSKSAALTFDIVKIDRHQLFLERKSVLGGDTLVFKKVSPKIVGFEKQAAFVYQQSLDSIQLYGVYQHVLNKSQNARLASELAADEQAAINIRFYPDSTLMMGISVFKEKAEGFDRCTECDRVNAQFFPPPFNNVHAFSFKKEGLVTFSSQIGEMELIWNLLVEHNDLILTIKNADQPEEGNEMKFTFVPFKKLNYLFNLD